MSYKTTKGTPITNTMQVSDLTKKYIRTLHPYIYFKLLYILDDDVPKGRKHVAYIKITQLCRMVFDPLFHE